MQTSVKLCSFSNLCMNIMWAQSTSIQNCPHPRSKKRAPSLNVKAKRLQRIWKKFWNCFHCSCRRHVYPLAGKNALWKAQRTANTPWTIGQQCRNVSLGLIHSKYQKKDPAQLSATYKGWMLLPIFVTREHSAFNWAARSLVILRCGNTFHRRVT